MSKFYINQDIVSAEILSAIEGIYGLKNAWVDPNGTQVRFNKFISVVYGCMDRGDSPTIRFKTIIGNKYWITCESLFINKQTMTISNGLEKITVDLNNLKWMILWSLF